MVLRGLGLGNYSFEYASQFPKAYSLICKPLRLKLLADIDLYLITRYHNEQLFKHPHVAKVFKIACRHFDSNVISEQTY